MAHMSDQQKQALRDAVKAGKTIQHRNYNWVDVNNPDMDILELMLNDSQFEWQVKPATQGIRFDIPAPLPKK